MKLFKFSPLTEKRLQRFRRSYVAAWSLKLLVALYLISLVAELICNNKPLYLRYEGETYFPFLTAKVPEKIVERTGSVQVNYRVWTQGEDFKANPDNMAVFAPVPYGPGEILDTQDLEASKKVTLDFIPVQPLARFNLSVTGKIVRENGCTQFFPGADLRDDRTDLKTFVTISPELADALVKRFAGEAAEAFTTEVQPAAGRSLPWQKLTLSLPATAGGEAPASLRVNLSSGKTYLPKLSYTFKRDLPTATNPTPAPTLLEIDGVPLAESGAKLPTDIAMLTSLATQAFTRDIDMKDNKTYTDVNGVFYAIVSTNNIRFPFPPTAKHLMGIDGAGHDVFARILYGMRIAVSFGLMLAIWATIIGIIFGAAQGYFGGVLDICMQRLTEVWSSLPFLYIMVLVGAVFGRNFWLLLFCYGIFSWIGLSRYMRGEFLRLRNRPFVDAARCQGLGNPRIIFHHILPNALTPMITLFPFSLVGAISSLVSLDFLGFGLPPLTPSWGELLQQAQVYRWAWWLILFPTLAIFVVMFLTVMVGEGVRNAFDPKPYAKME